MSRQKHSAILHSTTQYYTVQRVESGCEVLLYLQDDPVTVLSCQVDCLLGYDLLTLTQRHIVEVVVVECVTQLPP